MSNLENCIIIQAFSVIFRPLGCHPLERIKKGCYDHVSCSFLILLTPGKITTCSKRLLLFHCVAIKSHFSLPPFIFRRFPFKAVSSLCASYRLLRLRVCVAVAVRARVWVTFKKVIFRAHTNWLLLCTPEKHFFLQRSIFYNIYIRHLRGASTFFFGVKSSRVWVNFFLDNKNNKNLSWKITRVSQL